MAKTREYSRWAIVGEVGLYCGQHLTRKDAIAEHVEMRYGIGRYTFGRGLSTAQLEMWHKLQAKGDRCVKVRVIVPVGSSGKSND